MRGATIFAATIFAAALGTAFPGQAQDADEREEMSTYVMDPVVSTVHRADTIMMEEAVSPEDIDQATSSKTADDLLKDVAGIDVRRASPTGDLGGAISIRGFGEGQSLIMLDGRPLNGAGVYGGQYVDWSSLSTEDIERIEIVRGAKSAEYGNTLGGVINIITKHGTFEPRTTVGMSYGSFQTYDLTASHSGSYKNTVSYNFSLGRAATASPYLRNNDVTRNNFAARTSFMLPAGLVLSLRARYTDHDRGLVVSNLKSNPYYDDDYPESSSNESGGPGISFKGGDYTWGDGSYAHNIREQYDLEIGKNFGPLLVNFQYYLNDQSRTEHYYAITDEDHQIMKRFAKPEDNTRGWSLKAEQTIRDHNLTAGLEGVTLVTGKIMYREYDAEYLNTLPTSSDTSDEKNIDRVAGYIQDDWQVADSFYLHGGLRYDSYTGHPVGGDALKEVNENVLSPRAGLTWRGWETGTVEVHAARAVRFPGVPEYYWYYSGHQPAGRKDLSPEDALQFEAGLTQRVPGLGSFIIRGYTYRVEDYLRVIFGYKPSRVVYNIDKVTLTGLELSSSVALPFNLSVSGNYTFQTTKKEGDILDNSMNLTDRLTELPEHKVNLSLSASLPRSAKAELSMRYVGERKYLTGSLSTPDAAVLETADAFATVDLFGSMQVWSQGRYAATVRAGIENMFAADYMEREGFPMPGRTFTVSFDQSF